jgi:hypothetical protein
MESMKSPKRKSMKVSSPKRKSMKPSSPVRGRKVTKSKSKKRDSSSSSRSSSGSDSDCDCDTKKNMKHSKYDVPKGVYPPGFDICGYAKELYDANKGKKSFEYADFHKVMAMYSMVFCFEKELRKINKSKAKKNMKFAWASYDGTESALNGVFEECKMLLWKSEAEEKLKNLDIREIHTKNILELLK